MTGVSAAGRLPLSFLAETTDHGCGNAPGKGEAAVGYFDGLTSGSFKTTASGQRLFFPWGSLGRGYRIESEERFQQLRRQVKTYLMVSLPLTVAIVVSRDALGLAAVAALVAVLIVGYAIWAVAQCRQLATSEERLTYGESVANQARAHNTVMLWALEIASLLFVALGVVIVVAAPEQRILGVVTIAFFGFAAAMGLRMIRIKRSAARAAR
jgi:hypothetical protein